jgi:hypothetical protein
MPRNFNDTVPRFVKFGPPLYPHTVVLSARDYRDLNDISSFAKLVTVGMIEHVGESGCHSTFNTPGNCCGQVEFSLTTACPVYDQSTIHRYQDPCPLHAGPNKVDLDIPW